MAKSAEQVKREYEQLKRSYLNADIRQRLEFCSQVDGLFDLEIIESLIQHHNDLSYYHYGESILEPDVAEKLDALRKRCVQKLRKDAAFELERYKKQKANGASPQDLERLRTQAAEYTAKANSIQRTLDMIEAEKRRATEQKAAEERRKAEQAKKTQQKAETITKRAQKIAPIVIAVVIPIVLLIPLFIKPMIINHNIEKFHDTYEKNLQTLLDEYDLELNKVEYAELVPDNHLDYWSTERVNEYEVKVYLNEKAPSYSKIYEILRKVRTGYLLSNTYKMLSGYAYLDDDSKETGFHEVITILVFEDNSAYRKQYSTMLEKDGEIVWDNSSKAQSSNTQSFANTDTAPPGTCMYSGCDGNRAEGKYYCHIHKCAEEGCTNSTMPHLSYCERHNCIYSGCGAAKYKFAGSDYCQTHYVHQ